MATTLRLYETRTLLDRKAFTGNVEENLHVVTGSRMLITLLVNSADSGANVTLFVDNSFTGEEWDTIENLGITGAAGRVKRVISDYHNNFRFRVQVTGGSVDFKVGVTSFDNAGTTRIDNAQLSVSLDHTVDSLGHFDSIRIGDGVHLLAINLDGSINVGSVESSALPDGAATEAKQDVEITAIGTLDDNLASELSALEAALHTDNLSIASKIDTVDSDLNSGLGTLHIDNVAVEGKLDTIDASLGSIDAKVATEATLASFESANHADLLAVQTRQDSTNTKLDTLHSDLLDIETKQDSTNTKLDTIHADLVVVEGKQDSTNTKLDTLHSDLTVVETKQDSTNTKLDTLHTDLVTVEGKQDTGNTSLASIDGHLDTNLSTRATETTLDAFKTANHTDALGVQTRQDSTNTKLDTLHADIGVVETKQDSTNTKLDTIHADLVTVEGKQDTALTEAQSFHADNNARIGATSETAAATDTSTSGLNGLIKRVAQRLTSIFTGQSDGTQKSRVLDTNGYGITSEAHGSTRNLNVIIGDSYQRDAWGRVRVADTDLIESLHFSNGAHPLLVNTSVAGSGTAAFNSSTSSIRLTATTLNGDSAILQTKRYFRYNPGRSYIVSFSGSLGAKKANTRQRAGYFDANNGLFFQQDSTNLAVVVRTDASGSPVDTAINQSAWNIDKLDGTGASGVTLDTTKHNLYVIDFLWHGAGRIRFGILYNGYIIYCHEVMASNVNSNPYMRVPSLPIRAELTNTGVSASTTTMDIVCFAYQKEASDNLGAPYQFSASTGRTSTVVAATILPIISIRPKLTFNALTNRVPVVPLSVSAVSSAQAVIVSIVLNPTLTGASFNSVDANSATEVDIAATATSGGTIIKQFYLAASSSLSASSSADLNSALEALVLGLNIAGSTADIVTVTIQSTSGNTNVFAQIDWQEFQ